MANIKGAVIFDADRFAALSRAMLQVTQANRSVRAYQIYETPVTMSFIKGDDPRDWRIGHPLPDRWFIHWDQFAHG